MISKFAETVYRSGRELIFGDHPSANTDVPHETTNPLGILEGTEHLYYVRACNTCGQPQHLLHSGWIHDDGFYTCVPTSNPRNGLCRYCRRIVEPTANGWIHQDGNYRCASSGLFEYDHDTYGFADAMNSVHRNFALEYED